MIGGGPFQSPRPAFAIVDDSSKPSECIRERSLSISESCGRERHVHGTAEWRRSCRLPGYVIPRRIIAVDRNVQLMPSIQLLSLIHGGLLNGCGEILA